MAKAVHSIEFTRAAWLSADHFILGGHLPAYPDARVTRIVEYRQGQWSQLADLPEIVASLSVSHARGIPTIHAMLRNGVIHSWTEGKHHVEVIDRNRHLFFNELKEVGGCLFACGAGHQVFRRIELGWSPIDVGIFIDPKAGRSQAMLATRSVLTSIDGQAADSLFVVGASGVIMYFDGASWSSTESPTNLGLMRIRRVGDRMLACGYHGLVVEGGKDGWRILHHQHGSPSLFDIATFGDRVFLASEFSLFELRGSALSEVDVPTRAEPTFGSLSGDESTGLVSVGGEDLFTFNGERWSRLECPWNAEL